jgi:hypothetical protein
MLLSRKVEISGVTDGMRRSMYHLFSHYYENVAFDQFNADLAAKDFVLLLEDAGELVGFTGASLFQRQHSGETIRIVFSGDTIMARQHWGKQTLAKAWLREMGYLAKQAAPQRLFWFLIVKGHRTYRYLPAFALHYFPGRMTEAKTALQSLRDALADGMFGSAFDPVSGIIRFAAPRGNLQHEWAAPSERELRLPDVAYFLQANPGYAQGDELACLCEISRTNMRPLAQRWFDLGHDA